MHCALQNRGMTLKIVVSVCVCWLTKCDILSLLIHNCEDTDANCLSILVCFAFFFWFSLLDISLNHKRCWLSSEAVCLNNAIMLYGKKNKPVEEMHAKAVWSLTIDQLRNTLEHYYLFNPLHPHLPLYL